MSKAQKSRLEQTFTCPVCGKDKPAMEIFSGQTIRPALYGLVKKYNPDWTPDLNICLTCLNKVRSDFVERSLMSEKGNLTSAEQEVLDAIRNQEVIAASPSEKGEESTLGIRVADRIAEVGGSWKFIIVFSSVIVIWVALNSYQIFFKPFDPFPYILLNLMLSCVAALQAPVIMMSQNRQETKDRRRAEADYKTNLKAELEIRHLHMKLDQLITHQWHRLLEIQQVQLDMMKETLDREKK